MTPLGTQIRLLREDRDWTLKELAARAGLSFSYIHDIEVDGKYPSLNALMRIADAFGLGVGDLLTDAGYTVREREFQPVRLVEVSARLLIGSNGEARYINHRVRSVIP